MLSWTMVEGLDDVFGGADWSVAMERTEGVLRKRVVERR